MKAFKDTPIKRKLTLVIAFTSALALFLSYCSFVAYELIANKRLIKSELSTLAKIIGENSAASLIFNDKNYAMDILSALKAKDQITSAYLYQEDGGMFAAYLHDNASKETPPPCPSNYMEDVINSSGGYLQIFHQIFFDDERVGTVYLKFDMSEIYSDLALYSGVAFVILIVFLFFALFLSSGLQKAISGPILRLAETAKVVSREKNYSVRELTHDSEDEVGILIKGFNEMLEQIQKRDLGLESLVSERTRELREAYKNLEKEMMEREQAEKALDESKVKMIHASRLTSLGEMATGVAHEINQPLTFISGFIQSLGLSLRQKSIGEIDEAKLRKNLKDASHQVARIVSIIDHLRSFGRRSDMPGENANLEKILDDALLLIRERLRLRDIRLSINAEENLPAVKGNPNQLEQVFINLFQNSLDAFENKTGNAGISVDIGISDDRKSLKIRFSDNGPGIDESIIDRIFEPFFTTKDVGKGTGLGLFIVYGIIKDHHGVITCESEINQGTTFTIIIPVRE
ncbi:MAG: HAMP domain-containing protein [Nitrospinae bacterium]|nr:HAMP domain-containing protein [Nitrospinota bacterium]